jgi:adenosylhomocysteine nucleosidase
MLLRWLVNQYVGRSAREQLQGAVLTSLEGFAKGAVVGRNESSGSPTSELAPPCDLAIAFALGMEAGGTVDLLEKASVARGEGFIEHAGTLRGKEAVVIETGVGAAAAAKAVSDVIGFHEPAWVISAGFAGALAPGLRRGHIVMPREIVCTGRPPLSVGFQLDAAQTPGLHVGRLVTVDRIIRTRAEKETLGQQHQALACDMESYAIAEVCRQKQVRFLSVRIITDALEEELPREVERLLAQKTLAGKLGAAARAVMQRPGSAIDLMKLQDQALTASDRLAKFLAGLVVQLGT